MRKRTHYPAPSKTEKRKKRKKESRSWLTLLSLIDQGKLSSSIAKNGGKPSEKIDMITTQHCTYFYYARGIQLVYTFQ